ncbi:MAG TPA: ornithine cyclodeaminase family protein [Pyrinomonadaceae bacterium]|jgi:ornithine cyclodeaminase/alanine dehydrogenase|nr:ornithine cyclodeaminase family protein [Pyrinomonadaceae bacterium]
MKAEGTLLLKRRDVAELLSIEECIAAVERVFRLQGEGKTTPPGVLGLHTRAGGFHIKAGLLELDRSYFAAKTNANFPQNVKRHNLPLIQGVIVLCDAENGYPLAVMDSIEITIQRTGAATAVAAKHLARPDSKTATICGCGNQGRISLRALAAVMPIEKVLAYDNDEAQAQRFARELGKELRIEVAAVRELERAVGQSDICITCTPSTQPFLRREPVAPGTFIAAVGADSPEKRELEPSLMRGNKIVVDILEQCARFGELHHALDSGQVTKEHVHAELGEVLAGVKPGRISDREIIIFDSTGMALQDVVAAAAVYEKAVRTGTGITMSFSE